MHEQSLFLEALRKHGVTTLLVGALWWMNARLEKVEDKSDRLEAALIDCLEDKQIRRKLSGQNLSKEIVFAILPKNEKYERNKRKDRSKNA